MNKRALITGITGQDGAYLAKNLLEHGYEVHGLRRRCSVDNTSRLTELLGKDISQVVMHYGDMTDSASLIRIINQVKPDEIYNLAAQSHVHVSFETPEYTGNADAIGTVRLLEAIRLTGAKIKFYQASTSELFGNSPPPQSEVTPFKPRSPYAAAKIYAHCITINYREAYNIFASCGILFNHESPLRGEQFVTRKISLGVARIASGMQEKIILGNLDAKRDWGHAADYVEGMRRILAHEKSDDFVLSTGEAHTVRELVELAFGVAGINIAWEGHGVNEKGYDRKTNKTIVAVAPAFFRPSEVDYLLGDATKARTELDWMPNYTFEDIIVEMVEHDIRLIQ